MLETLTTLPFQRSLLVALIILAGLIFYGLGRMIPRMIKLVSSLFTTPETAEGYKSIFDPYRNLLGIVTALAAAEVAIVLIPKNGWLSSAEVGMSLTLLVAVSWLSSRLFRQFSDVYLLDAAFKTGRKLNSELLVVGKVVANVVIVLAAVILFAEGHHINIFGLFASLGVGGLAVAFAAKSTLEQVLGGVVILIDRPFSVDDYIGLSDGTFGRVESIGLRSTKIRTSGKGTLMVVPNSSLVQAHVENFTGAKKIMSILNLTFHHPVPPEERALIRQVIHETTDSIFGIDPRSTDISFREMGSVRNGKGKVQAQCTFFILGSGSATIELRQQLLDIANQRLSQKLLEYDISFDIEDPTIYIDSPITI